MNNGRANCFVKLSFAKIVYWGGGSTVRDEIQRAGNCNCGFLHCPKAFERQEYILLESGRAFLLMRV